MLFNSIEYFIFLPIVFILFWSLNGKKLKYQNFFLLIASYTFYGWWDWRFLSLIILSTFVDFFVSKSIYNVNSAIIKKRWLLLSLFVNLGILGFFKYCNFFIDTWIQLWGLESNSINYLNIILPVGISFYTFQTLSYTIDVYNKKLKPTNDLLDFAVYVALFPQLVAGPIERARNLLPQISSRKFFSFHYFNEGVLQIGVGLVKKMVIADTLSLYVDSIYANYSVHNSITLIFATYIYAIQIYCDFSGYSDIAIGTAKLFNLSFVNNFNRPYLSTSITDFWRRWHLSLSSWLKDYLYIPLGGNRYGRMRTYRNLWITMLLGGLWHGSSWNFVIWGWVHGFMLSIEKYFLQNNEYFVVNNIHIKRFLTFNLICMTWLIFRSPTLEQSYGMIKIVSSFEMGGGLFIGNINVMAHIVLGLIIFLLFNKFFDKEGSYNRIVKNVPNIGLQGILIIFLFMIILFYQGNNNAFIYFQF